MALVGGSNKVLIFDTEVFFTSHSEWSNNPVKTIKTDINFVTISSAYAKDVKIEDYIFDKPVTVITDYLKGKTIHFTLSSVSNLKEVIWNASKIYVEMFKKYATPEGRPLKGYEFLYLRKVKIYKDNLIELKIEKIVN